MGAADPPVVPVVGGRVVKLHADAHGAARERRRLRLLAGPGLAPLADPAAPAATDDRSVVTAAGHGTVADVLAERGPLGEPASRAVGAATARAVARLHERGVVHGDLKPANLVLAPDGMLWLVDLDAAGPPGSPRHRGSPPRHPGQVLDERGDVLAVAVLTAECATGVVIDPAAGWTAPALADLGCPPDLAADLAGVFASAPPARRVAGLLDRADARLPPPAVRTRFHDPTPTVEVAPTAISGLAPLGKRPAGSD